MMVQYGIKGFDKFSTCVTDVVIVTGEFSYALFKIN